MFYNKSYTLLVRFASQGCKPDNSLSINTQARLSSGARLLRGKQEENWTDGPLKGWAWKGNVPPPMERSSIACYWGSLKATYATL